MLSLRHQDWILKTDKASGNVLAVLAQLRESVTGVVVVLTVLVEGEGVELETDGQEVPGREQDDVVVEGRVAHIGGEDGSDLLAEFIHEVHVAVLDEHDVPVGEQFDPGGGADRS